jgi:hypothetical protein
LFFSITDSFIGCSVPLLNATFILMPLSQAVRVWRLTVSDSVEDKLLHLQERKRQLAHAALETNRGDDNGDASGGGGGDGNGDAVGGEDGTGVVRAESGGKKQDQQQRLTVGELTDFFR